MIVDWLNEFTSKSYLIEYNYGVLKSAQMVVNVCVIYRVIEKYTDNARFCIICNYLSKIIPPLQVGVILTCPAIFHIILPYS